MRHVAIVGSGPAGCYLADALLRGAKDCRVDLIDRLPTPFGLVRSGVAPDHQSTKGVTRLLERVLARPELDFFGGVELGRDVSLDDLRAFYDAVVLATGAPLDRRLGVPGETLSGVFPSSRFVGWYNAHPDHTDVAIEAARSVVIVGNGNVALDVARVLAKTDEEFHGSDIDPLVSAHLSDAGVTRIEIAGRRSAAHMKFTAPELLEFGELRGARAMLSSPSDLDGVDGAAADALRAACLRPVDAAAVEVRFSFGMTPVAFVGDAASRLRAVRFRSRDGGECELPADLAVTCVGYETSGHGLAVENGALANDDGTIAEGLYAVGWARRGPSGTIPTNRTEALAFAPRLLATLVDGGRPGGPALRDLLAERGVPFTDYAGWRRIDASEVARGGDMRCRRKWRTIEHLLASAEGEPATAVPR